MGKIVRPPDRAYHVILDGKGYVILDESYARESQEPFHPRFSTGDPSLTDLSPWQFISQESWIGGAGQVDFEDKTKYRQATGWDIRDGKPKLAFSPRKLTLSSDPPTAQSGNVGARQAKWIFYRGEILLAYNTTDGSFTDFARTTLISEDTDNNIPKIIHFNVDDVIIWSHNAGNGLVGLFLVTFGPNVVKIFNLSFLVKFEKALEDSPNLAEDGIVMEISNTRFYLAYLSLETVKLRRFTFADGSFTNTEDIQIDLDSYNVAGKNVFLVKSSAKDTNGTLHFAVSFYDNQKPRFGSRLYRVTSDDQVGLNARVTQVDDIKNFIIIAIRDIAGVVYFLGLSVDSAGAKKQIRRVDGTVLWESTKVNKVFTASGDQKDFIMPHDVSLDGILFLADNDRDEYRSLLLMDKDERIREVAAFAKNPADIKDILGVTEFSNSYFLSEATVPAIRSTKLVRGQLEAGFDQAVLELSSMGANTPLIVKSLYSFFIEVSEAVPKNFPLTIEVNGIVVGTLKSTDGLEKEIITTEEIVTPAFKTKIKASRNSTWQGKIERVNIRYLPVQFKKLTFSFAVRADNNQKLLGTFREKRTGVEIHSDLETTWKSNKPIEFKDTKGEKFKVIVTKIRARQPILSERLDRREFIVPIELLEI